MKKSILLLMLYLGLTRGVCAQAGYNNHWITAFGSWISFDTSPATLVADYPDAIFCQIPEPTYNNYCTLSDTLGNPLLLWSGMYLIDMRYSNALLEEPSIIGDGVLMPLPGGEKVFLFYPMRVSDANKLIYRMITITNQGMEVGKPVVFGKGVEIVAVKHANNVDIWLITADMEEGDFDIYLVEGDNPPKIVQSVDGKFISFGVDRYSNITFSPALDYAILPYSLYGGGPHGDIYGLYSFNNQTGELEELQWLDKISAPSFSADGRYIYANNVEDFGFCQYEQRDGKWTVKQKILPFNVVWSQRGPDGKIYAGLYGIYALWESDAGTGQHEVLKISDQFQMHGPQICYWTNTAQSELRSRVECLRVSFSVSVGQQIVSYAWDFGDGHRSTESAPQHTYAKAGNYAVKVTLGLAGQSPKVLEKQITITELPKPLTISWE